MDHNSTQFIVEFKSGRWIPPRGSVAAELMEGMGACPRHRRRLLAHLYSVGLRTFGLWWPATLARETTELSSDEWRYVQGAWADIVDRIGG